MRTNKTSLKHSTVPDFFTCLGHSSLDFVIKAIQQNSYKGKRSKFIFVQNI